MGHDERAVRDEALPWLLSWLPAPQRDLCIAAAGHYAESHPDTSPFASPVRWAPFTAAGLSDRAACCSVTSGPAKSSLAGCIGHRLKEEEGEGAE
jgi:hypothetical protein